VSNCCVGSRLRASAKSEAVMFHHPVGRRHPCGDHWRRKPRARRSQSSAYWRRRDGFEPCTNPFGVILHLLSSLTRARRSGPQRKITLNLRERPNVALVNKVITLVFSNSQLIAVTGDPALGPFPKHHSADANNGRRTIWTKEYRSLNRNGSHHVCHRANVVSEKTIHLNQSDCPQYKER
jgi:hypothetical protein